MINTCGCCSNSPEEQGGAEQAVLVASPAPRISACRVCPRRAGGGAASPGGSCPGTLCPPARGAAWSCWCPAPTTGTGSGRDTGIIHREKHPPACPEHPHPPPVPGWVVLRDSKRDVDVAAFWFFLRQLFIFWGKGKAAPCRRGHAGAALAWLSTALTPWHP